MFEKIEDVPAPLAEFYCVETRSEQQFNEDGSPAMQEVEYQYTDEAGNPATGTRMEPVFADNTYVISAARGESKTLDDVWRIVKKHAGRNDDLVRKFLSMVCCDTQWTFHDEYLDWYQRGLELDAVVLPEPVEGEPDPLVAHQELIAAHAAKEPIKPSKIDCDQWFIDNYSKLREAAYAPQRQQDEMLFDDTVNGTTTWIDHNKAVKAQYPKAEGDQ